MQWDCMVNKTKCSVTHCLLVMGWNAIKLHGKENQMQCYSHPVGCGMKCNETAWERKKNAVSLTYCWSWDGMHWDCMRKKNKCNVAHILSWDEMQWDCTVKKKKTSVTHTLLVMGQNAMRLHWNENQMQCHSHPVGHVMRLHGKEKNAVSHTSCCSWDEMQWDCILKKTKCSVTHSLLVMGWNAMRLHCKEKQMQCHSHTVGHGMTCNEIEWWRQNDVLSLTYCWDGMWSDCTVNIYL